MTAVMFDSDTPDLLLKVSAPGQRLATYTDLLTPAFITAAGDRLVGIDRGHGDPHGKAVVVDIERGLYTPQSGAQRIRELVAAGGRQVTAYCNRSNYAAVDQALGGLHVHHWVSTLDGTLVPAGEHEVAVQFAGAAQLGFHADISIVWNDQWLTPTLPTVPKVPAGIVNAAADVLNSMHALASMIDSYK